MNRVFYGLFVLAVLLACSSDDQNIDTSSEIPVSVSEVKFSAIREPIITTGTVQAVKEVVLKSEMEGFYRLNKNPQTGKTYRMGDWVTATTVIAFLDNPERENEIRFDSKNLNLETYQREYDKQKSLYEKGGVTLSELKNAEASLINAKYDYENALIALAKFKITPPLAGYITDLPFYTTSTLVASGSIIAEVMDYRQLLLTINLPDKEMGRVKTGQAVLVLNYTTDKDTLYGAISEMAPALDADSRTFKTNIIIENPENILRPGMFVKAEIVVAEKSAAIVIPKDVVLNRYGRKVVFVVDKGAAQEKQIETGLQNRDQIEVTEGLELGERLIIKGFETLRNRSRVKIIH
jgi:RND family efflux transporter MFP subunit